MHFPFFATDDKDATELLRNLHLADRELILLTVNDSLDVDFSGSQGPSGSHWSLLAFERASSTFYYLDSLRSQSNEPSGRALVGKLKRLLKVPKARFVTLAVPLQENSYDCGMSIPAFTSCGFLPWTAYGWNVYIPYSQLYSDPDVHCSFLRA